LLKQPQENIFYIVKVVPLPVKLIAGFCYWSILGRNTSFATFITAFIL